MKYLLCIYSILSCFCVFAQKEVLQLLIEEKSVDVGQEITVTVKSNIRGRFDLDFPEGFEQGYSVMSGMEKENNQNTGKTVTFYYHSQNGKFTKPGTYVVGPAYIKKGRKVYASNSVTIEVHKKAKCKIPDISASKFNQPAFGIIESKKKEVYEGEAVLLNSKVFARFQPTHIDDYITYELDGSLESYPIGNSQNISIKEEQVGSENMFVFSHDMKLVFANIPGTSKLKGFGIGLKSGLQGFSFESESFQLKVLPLPSNKPFSFTGGVGEFTMQRSVDLNAFQKNRMLVLKVEISGTGNLQNLIIPPLDLPKAFVLYGDPIVHENFKFGLNGATGKITYIYNVKVVEENKVFLPDFSFSYFDPNKEEYITLKEDGFQLDKSTDPINLSQNHKVQSEVIDYSKPVALHSENQIDRSIPLMIGSILIPILSLGFLFMFIRKRKEKQHQLIKEEHEVVVDHTKSESAENFIRTTLSKANKSYENNETTEFYSYMHTALLDGAKSFVGIGEGIHVSAREIIERLNEKEIEKEFVGYFKNSIAACEAAKYGLTDDDQSKKLVHEEANKAIEFFLKLS